MVILFNIKCRCYIDSQSTLTEGELDTRHLDFWRYKQDHSFVLLFVNMKLWL